MNQKYLQGISSDMENLDSTVFFEATPENISAFWHGTGGQKCLLLAL